MPYIPPPGQVQPSELPQAPETPRPRRRRRGWTLRLTPSGFLLLLLLNLGLLGGLAYGLNRAFGWYATIWPGSATPTPGWTQPPNTITPLEPTATTEPPTTTATPPGNSPTPYIITDLTEGLILLALDDYGYTHLFAYQPQEGGSSQPLQLARITYGPWDDITPALSPDGQHLAFASNRSGYWDLYLLDLPTGMVTRMTDSLEYEAAPAWSPDGQWLAYEAYQNEQLDILILSITTPGEPIPLTNHPAADHSPAWSPKGRQIAFVSNRSGEAEIWLADLDQAEGQRFTNFSQNPLGDDTHPAWSPDGNTLLWSISQDGVRTLVIQETSQPADGTTTYGPRYTILGSGDWAVWNTDGSKVLALVKSPQHTYLTAYPVHSPGLVLPPLALPGAANGLTWGSVALPLPLRDPYRQAALFTPTPLWEVVITSQAGDSGGRYLLSPLIDVQAPQAILHDKVDEAFQAFREQIAIKSGWDFLSTLENAYVPLTSPLDPGLGEDWLYTGRAFAFITLPINAGWVAVVREDYNGLTYWRVYVRARFQDGSTGIPLHDIPWNFNTRFSGDTVAYEQGGSLLDSVPPGYWIDFTHLAATYGWERLPALTNWRAAYVSARYNEFVFTNGLDWHSAMLELYPPEVLITPSPVVPPSRTPTQTPRWYRTPTPTQSATPRPTFTPALPSPTPSPTLSEP